MEHLINISEINMPEGVECNFNQLECFNDEYGESIYYARYSPIIIDSDNNIIDGIHTYFIALSFDIQYVKVNKIETKKNNLLEKFKIGIAV